MSQFNFFCECIQKIRLQSFFFLNLNFLNFLNVIQMNFFTKVPQRGLMINASNGSLYWDYFRGKIEYKVGKKQKIINDYGIINNKKKNQMYVEEMIDFIKLCKSSKTYKSPISFHDGLEVRKVINQLS